MHRLKKLGPNDLANAEKLVRRISVSLEQEGLRCPAFSLEPLLEQDCVYLDKEGTRPIAIAVLRHEMVPYLAKNEKDAATIQEMGMLAEEQLNILTFFGVDPAYYGKKIGDELLAYLEGTYKHGSWFIKIAKNNQRALTFFKSKGYYPLCENQTSYLMLKRLKREGLASWNF